MRTCLIHHNGNGRLMQIDNAKMSADDWGDLEQDFAREAGGVQGEYASVLHLSQEEITPQGLHYHWDVTSPDGANYAIVAGKDTPQADIDKAKDYIRNTGDPVRLNVIRVNWI